MRLASENLGEISEGPSPAPAPRFEDSPVFRLGYRRWLDGLRGVAVLMVLAFHFRLLGGGWLGVDIFFVLSGFLITSLLLEEWQQRGTICLKRFYLRRALRLMPAFFTLLILCGIYALVFQSAEEAANTRREMAVAACYISNWPWLHNTNMPMLGHTWSLSVEEQFYLLWPLLLYGMLRCGVPRKRIIRVTWIGIITCVLYRLGLHFGHPPSGAERMVYTLRIYMGLDTRADALLVGCFAGMLVSWNLVPRSRRFITGMSIASVIYVAVIWRFSTTRSLDHVSFYYGLFTVVALMVATVIIRLMAAPAGLASTILESKPLVGIGRISYGLYLFHVPIIYWVSPSGLGWQYPGSTLLVAALTLAAAVLSFFCVERPFLRLKRRLHFASSESNATASVSISAGNVPQHFA